MPRAYTDSPRYIVQQLPSKLRGIEGRRWDLKVDPHVYDLSIDSSQDLVVFAARSPEGSSNIFQLRSLSTGDVHPFACSSGVIELGQLLPYKTSLDICGKHILAVVRPIDAMFYVWNWRTGHVALSMIVPSDASRTESACFLDDRHIIVVASDLPDEDAVRLLIQEVPKEGTNTSPSFSFALPAFLRKSSLASLRIRSSVTSRSPRGPCLFYADPDDRLLYVHAVMLVDSFYEEFMITIPSRTFTSYIVSHSPAQHPVDVGWEDWGPSGSRVSRIPPRAWLARGFLVSGMRMVSSAPSLNAAGSRYVFAVYDYHPLRVARAASLRGAAGGVVLGDEVPAQFTGAGYGAVTTTMPYLVNEIPLPAELSNLALEVGELDVALCEDGILMFRYSRTRIQNVWSYTF
ncbi:hypothetical protein BV25DRAFT_1826596 [Artomyces pyxidatus]|uniref:Uncharacterized protein n=1 Tax=Artomyces pyxidatus TaxID=48021 RepID=A0ACB8T021_9AGAM|nr:hypothetical protein BV25DRAFT_1826596 [Artomyces pyxidatus]